MCQDLLDQTGHMVFSGPFATMKLIDGLALAGDPRMIIGSYELEIHEVINDVIVSAPTTVVDIGAAFGYYAVGFALKIAKTNVIAFEAVEKPHWQELAELAKINQVEGKILQQGLCTPEALAEVCTADTFILSDCEGGEEELLNPHRIPVLKSCKILIELHEFHRPNLVGVLVDRFRSSHSIRIIEEMSRDPSRYRILNKLPPNWRSIATQEVKWIPNPPRRTTTWLRFMLLIPN